MAELLVMKTPEGLLLPLDAEAVAWCAKLAPGESACVVPRPDELGSLSMLNTWRGWMRETARCMAARGAKMPLGFDDQGEAVGWRAFNEYDAHELFTALYLGTDTEGRRYRWSVGADTRPGEVAATKEQRLHAMDLHVVWCTERGIKITIPERSEYARARQRQQGG